MKDKNMKYVVHIMGLIALSSCSYLQPKRSVDADVVITPAMRIQYARDKQEISDCFITNVEYFRKYHRHDLIIYSSSPDSLKKVYNEHYSKYPGANRDPANFFIPYSSRYNLKTERYVASPLPTDTQLSVYTDTIIYNTDSLFCFAFLILESKYRSIEGLENARKKGREFDAKAIIGYRQSVDSAFDIYPVRNHSVVGFESYTAAAVMIKDLYGRYFKGRGLAGSVCEGQSFKKNVFDKGFFEGTPYFKKHESGLYNFQMYRYSAKDHPYQYIRCGSCVLEE